MTTISDLSSRSMLAKEPESCEPNPVLLSRGPNENDAATAALNHHLWDKEEWAEKITEQGYVHESKGKLQRRITEFLAQADPTERNDFNSSRMKLLNLMKAAQAEQENKYPATTAESVRTRRQIAQTKIKAGCKAFSEVAYEYSNIMDVLVGQAPEYVSLVWGAIKIVLVVQINYQELKQKVKDYLEQIRIKFETIDHLTAYMPNANLVVSVAKAYELLSRFLAKAVKYYSLNRFKATWRAISKPWKVNLQGLVDEIDVTFANINDISRYHGLIEGHISLVMGQESLQNSQRSIAMHEKSLARLSDLETLMEQLNATMVRFSKERDIHQTANLLRQCVDESLQNPEQQRASSKVRGDQPTEDKGSGQTAFPTHSTDLESLCDEIFLELRDLHLDISRREKAIEQSSDMRSHRSRQKNIMRTDQVMSWVNSKSSQLLWIDGDNVLRRTEFSMWFTAPLLVLGESKYETTLILRHFCGDQASHKANRYCTLLQALLYQLFQQHPHVLARKKASLTRELTSDVAALWLVFLDCLQDVNAQCTFIVIDNIDVLGKEAGIDVEDGRLVIEKLNGLVQDETKLVKILLTASLAADQASSLDGHAALAIPRRKGSLAIVQDELALVPHKLIEIQQKRCKAVSFAEIPMLYVPNTTIYTVENGELRAFVIVELSGMEPQSLESYNALQMRAWSVDHNGRNIARRYSDLTIPQFSGQREIKDLRYIPGGYLPKEAEQRRALTARGRLWWTKSSGIHHVVAGSSGSQGVIDQKNRQLVIDEHNDFQDEFANNTTFTLKPLYLIVCPAFIDVFMLQELKWMAVKTSEITDHQYNANALDNLVLPREEKLLLKSLCDARKGETLPLLRKQFDLDGFMTTKKGSLVVLLHGRPGAGKTFTTECVANYNQCPLLALTAGDLPSEPRIVEETLRRYFKLAALWDAILLLDEADVLLEQRSRTDFVNVRNSIVSVFLRAIDHHQGILFLTTNRSDTIDNAFQSRIHVNLFLRPLNRRGRHQLWDMLFDTLKSQRADVLVNRETIEYARDSSESQELDWNGRQIQNVFHTAVSLAEFEAREGRHKKDIFVEMRHFEQVINMSMQSKRFTQILRDLNSSEHSKQDGIRNRQRRGLKNEERKLWDQDRREDESGEDHGSATSTD